ncbi:MAG: type I glyceraldehyde-3-phosphate dehydrogenase [Bacteroidales bacterium]|nr:type I glyceraldehyde-3-phosphate dehydrogenase [Bacteroidales bacterium]
MMKVGINGLGRIGRAVFKLVQESDQLELVALNDLASPENLAYLINYDTVYGRYEKKVEFSERRFLQEGKTIHVYPEKDPASIPWHDHKVDLVFDCTGVFNDKEGLQKHLESGAKKVILSAPAKNETIETVVFGVNKPSGKNDIISCASCTTNCISPVVEIIDRHFGIKKGTLTTVHAFTSTQGIVDTTNKKIRRGRAASFNFVPTSTGATKATTRVLAQLKGKFEGSAIRGPVAVGSISDLNFVIGKRVSTEEINNIFKEETRSERYRGILAVTDEPIVSSDIIKDPHASIIDLGMTMAIDGDLIKVMSWYDNEWGYANQMIRTAEYLADVKSQ